MRQIEIFISARGANSRMTFDDKSESRLEKTILTGNRKVRNDTCIKQLMVSSGRSGDLED